jgi:ribosome-associated toxin RatA of RatAB toxin-antitoxin module
LQARAILRSIAVVMLTAAALEPATAHAASAVNVSVRRSGEAIVIEASAQLRADAATAWGVLTDYGAYASFIPGLRSSRVVMRRDASVTVEQTSDATLWSLRMPLDVTYRITEQPPYRLESHATARLMRALESSYVLTPNGFGVRLDYMGRLAAGNSLLGRLEQSVAEESAGRQFRALVEEIERRSATPRASSAATTH